jgi:hypothetical protein
MSWNSRSKLNFVQYCKQIDTHTHTHTHTKLDCTLRKKILNLVQRVSCRMVDDASFSCESPSLDLNFCYPSLNLGCIYFPRKSSTLPVLEISCFLPKVLCFSPKSALALYLRQIPAIPIQTPGCLSHQGNIHI